MGDNTLTFADDDAAVARNAGPREAVLVGHTTGAYFAALLLATSVPEDAVVTRIACDTDLRDLSADLFERSRHGEDEALGRMPSRFGCRRNAAAQTRRGRG